MFRALRPVGERIPERTDGAPWGAPEGFELGWFGSGTSALAAVLQSLVADSDVAQPTFLVPAYTCPDVLSAIAFAGARPRLVDLVHARPWMDSDKLAASITDDVLAIIGIDFQGIPERLTRLRAAADKARLPLVYDHCQGFAPSTKSLALSDFLVFSFGRGKPAAALAGGAVLINRARQPTVSLPEPDVMCTAPSAVKRGAYNLLIHPRVYWLPSALPFLGLGQTRYHPLAAIEGLDATGIDAVQCAIRAYTDTGQAEMLHAYRRCLPTELDLAILCGLPDSTRLLRLVLLMPDAASKQSLLNVLVSAGLGASGLYPSALNALPGLPDTLRVRTEVPNAEDFAARLLTLPLHSGVSDKDIERIGAMLSAYTGG